MFDLMPWRKGYDNHLIRFRNELDSLFNHFFEQDFPMDQFFKDNNWNPRVDIHDGKKEITIKADLPGCDVKDINVNLDNGFLTISGEREQETEEKKDKKTSVERSYGYFSRTLRLPAEVDPETIDAIYKKGVLTLVMKKVREEAAGKKIEIKTT